jgi:hypothetical protein
VKDELKKKKKQQQKTTTTVKVNLPADSTWSELLS